MPIRNSLMNELMVPRTEDVRQRIFDFYYEIGWPTYPDADTEDFIYVQPESDLETPATFAYWLTQNPDKIAHFKMHEADEPSEFARGLRLPGLLDLVEISLVVPDDETVRTLYTRGGSVLEAHAYTPLRTHSSAMEFRIADPFNYSLRVTANPGYQLSSPISTQDKY